MNEPNYNTEQGAVSVTRASDSTLLIKLSGPWHLTRNVPSAAILRREIESAAMLETVSFDTSALTKWDSGLIAFLVQTSEVCRGRNIKQDRKGLPEGLRRLLELAEACPRRRARAATRSKPRSFNALAI